VEVNFVSPCDTVIVTLFATLPLGSRNYDAGIGADASKILHDWKKTIPEDFSGARTGHNSGTNRARESVITNGYMRLSLQSTTIERPKYDLKNEAPKQLQRPRGRGDYVLVEN
jgi:hypothetical protein